jgi:hypothetical protein
MDMQHGHGHSAWTKATSLDIGNQPGHCHASWTEHQSGPSLVAMVDIDVDMNIDIDFDMDKDKSWTRKLLLLNPVN